MTIAGIATSPGIGGISIIRMSGEESFDILNKIFVPKNKDGKIQGYTIKYGHIYDNDELIDEVLVSYFVAPRSYTTENLVEINSHGGSFIANLILELLIKNGARLAEPGEFTKLAFLNGRIDLTQAESVIDIINSKSNAELKASNQALRGSLSKEINNIKTKIIDLCTNIEVSIDYPEYDTPTVLKENLISVLNDANIELDKLINSYSEGKIIKDGVNVAIIGLPNAGKSSLLNRFLNEERAIVTNIAGTTRDVIEEQIVIDNIKLNLIDTAGIRESEDSIEKIGIEKSKEKMENADLIIYLVDSSKEISSEDLKILENAKDKQIIILLNKVDINNSVLESNKEKLKEEGFNNIIASSMTANFRFRRVKEKD